MGRFVTVVVTLLAYLSISQAQSTFQPSATSTVSPDDASLSSSVSAAAASLGLADYVTPLVFDDITEWIPLGDSFTAGIGSNGPDDYMEFSQDCSRYQQAYPVIMNQNEQWSGNAATRTLNFGACSGNKMQDVTDKQLSDNATVDYKNFGTPQVAVITISGNDIGFTDVINSCVIRAYGWPGITDCNEMLTRVENKIESIDFADQLDRVFINIIQK